MASNSDLTAPDFRLVASWRRTLEGIATLLGRLEYLSSLRNAHSGQYEHFGLSQRVGAAETDALLRRSHVDTFQEWLCLEQTEQRAEAENYLKGLAGDKREVVANWIALGPYTTWVPSDSRDVERELFVTDLADVIESIRIEYQVASRDPEL